MNILFDTHALLWFVEGSTELSDDARQLIEAADSIVYVSIASVWEMVIKMSLGKLSLGLPLDEYVSTYFGINGFTLLSMSVDHAAKIVSLPFITAIRLIG